MSILMYYVCGDDPDCFSLQQQQKMCFLFVLGKNLILTCSII